MPRRVAITGAAGLLGHELVAAWKAAGDDVLPLIRPAFDITRPQDLRRLVEWRPQIVVNAAAWTDVDGCARDPERAMEINGRAAGAVAEAAAAAEALAVQISTNEVFDGSLNRPYREDDEPHPINPYGISKLAGERLVKEAAPMHVIVRTAWLFGPSRGFPTRIHAAAAQAIAAGSPLRVVADEWGNPTDAGRLGVATVTLANLVEAHGSSPGAYHLAGWPPTSRLEWARWVLAATEAVLEPMELVDYPRDSTVPPRAVLDVTRASDLGIEVGSWS